MTRETLASSVRLLFSQGCAPLETVISLLGERSVVFKVFKPADLVVPDDVSSGVQSILTGEAPPQHLQVVTQAAAQPAAQAAAQPFGKLGAE